MSGLDEYDYLIYPGYMRRPMARWNEAHDHANWQLSGEWLHILIAQEHPHLAGKITGMLLELEDGGAGLEVVPADGARYERRSFAPVFPAQSDTWRPQE